MDDLIDRYIEIILPYQDVGISTDKDKYYELIAAGEDPAVQEEMGNLSGCALSVRGFWRLFGLRDPRIAGRYKPGMAVNWLVQIATERGGWFTPGDGRLPNPGDMVLVGGDKAKDGGVEHVYTVLDVSCDPVVIQSIDGGQVDTAGKQVIHKKQRMWDERDGAFWDVVTEGTDPGATAHGGRRVQGWACVYTVMAEFAKTVG
jgi:hypothetical protein